MEHSGSARVNRDFICRYGRAFSHYGHGGHAVDALCCGVSRKRKPVRPLHHACDPAAAIALTANAFDEDVQRSMQVGLNAHLSKPVEPAALFETLEELLR